MKGSWVYTDQGSRFQEFHRYMELKILIGTNLVIFFGGGTFVLKKSCISQHLKVNLNSRVNGI